jgi:serine/threonine-protein kinase
MSDQHADADDTPHQEDFSEGDPTVLTRSPVLRAEEFPAGLTPRELAHALQGELLNHFHLQEFIGGGGMGVVFKALDTTLHRIVAVKVVASQSISNEDLQRRFLIEAQSTARLDHPNIARIHFVGRDRGLPYIVFEYIEGENLRDLVLKHGPLPLGDALSYTYQVAHALAHAWQRDVVHRDIKPSNILITAQGQTKVVDMGLARLHEIESAEDDLTNTGVTLGTFDYISPEQARDPRSADTRSDIYSLGCTLFYLLAGRPPFARGTPVQKLLQHQAEQPPVLSDLRLGVPESVDRLLARMLAKNMQQRPQTPQELVQEIGAILQELGLPLPLTLAPLPAVEPARRTGKWRRVVPWAAPAAALLFVAAWLGLADDQAADHVTFPELRVATDSAAPPANPSQAAAEPLPQPTQAGTPIDVGAILPAVTQPSLGEPASMPDLLDAVVDPNAPTAPTTSGLLVPADERPLP